MSPHVGSYSRDYYSCLHEVTFIKSPFESLCINKILLNNYLNFTLQSLQYYYFNNFLRVKSWKSGVIRSFHMKFRKKSGIAQNQEKSGIIGKIRKCLTDCKKEEPWRKYLPNHSKWPSLLTIHSAQPPRHGTTYVRVHVLKNQPWLPSDKVNDHRELWTLARYQLRQWIWVISHRSKKATLVNTNARWGIISSIHKEHAWGRCSGPPQEDVSKSTSRDLVIASRL